MEAGCSGKIVEFVSVHVPKSIRVFVDGNEANKRVDGQQLLHLRSIITLIFQDSNVEKVVRLHGSSDSWENLYKIFEIIEGDGGLVVKRGWATKLEKDSFTGTAQSPAVIGDGARHGRQKQPPPPPSKRMMLREAKDLISRISHRWLDYKLSQQP